MSETFGATRPQRHKVSLFIGSEGKETEPFGRARDLSINGIFLETTARPAIGSVRELVFIWGDDTLTCPARIVRHAADGVGLTFISPDANFRQMIQEILDTSPPAEIAGAKSP